MLGSLINLTVDLPILLPAAKMLHIAMLGQIVEIGAGD